MEEEIEALRAEIKRLTSGMQGACYACEPVGMLNQKLEAENTALREALEKIASRPRGGVLDDPHKIDRDEFIGIARAALATQKEKTE